MQVCNCLYLPLNLIVNSFKLDLYKSNTNHLEILGKDLRLDRGLKVNTTLYLRWVIT